MRRALTVVLGLCVMSTLAFAQAKPEPKPEAKPEAKAGDLTDPVEILKKVDTAAKAAKFVKYKVVMEPTGAMATQLGKMEGTVYMTGWAGDNAEKFRCEAKVSKAGSAEVQDIIVGTDGKANFVIDNNTKKVYEPASKLMMGRTAVAAYQNMLLLEFVHPTPFTDEIKGKNHVLKGTRKIGDEDCYEISLDYSTTPVQSVTWIVSKKDFLPRGVERIQPTGGSRKWTVTELAVQPKTDKDPFKLEMPQGYTKATEGTGP